jgi:hypothetical protein
MYIVYGGGWARSVFPVTLRPIDGPAMIADAVGIGAALVAEHRGVRSRG